MTWDRTLKERLYPTGNSVDLVPVSDLYQHVCEGQRVPPEPDMTWDRTLKERLYPTGNSVDLVPVSD